VDRKRLLEDLKKEYPEKFLPTEEIFKSIRAGDRIFISTGCGEPQYLIQALVDYVKAHPKAFFDTEILHVWTLGTAPYTSEKLKDYFRHNSFFIGHNTREAVNAGRADYTPISFADVPELFRRRRFPFLIFTLFKIFWSCTVTSKSWQSDSETLIGIELSQIAHASWRPREAVYDQNTHIISLFEESLLHALGHLLLLLTTLYAVLGCIGISSSI